MKTLIWHFLCSIFDFVALSKLSFILKSLWILYIDQLDTETDNNGPLLRVTLALHLPKNCLTLVYSRSGSQVRAGASVREEELEPARMGVRPTTERAGQGSGAQSDPVSENIPPPPSSSSLLFCFSFEAFKSSRYSPINKTLCIALSVKYLKRFIFRKERYANVL